MEPFPATRLSVIRGANHTDARIRGQALDTLAAGYWKPVYKYLRFRWRMPAEHAEEFTQGFFAHALERDLFARYDPDRSRFRTYLRTCLDGFVANEHKAAQRLKRGGGVAHVALDVPGVEQELARQGEPASSDPEAYFHREWIRSVFGEAIDRLRAACAEDNQHERFALFECHDLATLEDDERPTYRELAQRAGLTVHDVTNHLAAARRQFRVIVFDLLCALCGSEADARAELRDIFGAHR
jgi:RNA polymerase sigma factor (sigma-70 family)